MFRRVKTYDPSASSGAVRKLRFFLLIGAVALAGCDDPLGPSVWNDTPFTVRLWSIDRVEHLTLPSAFDFYTQDRVSVEYPNQSMNWDFMLSDVGGGLALRPQGAYPDFNSRAGIAVITDRSFEEIDRAPGDGAYVTDAAVPVSEGDVLVVRSRLAPCFYGSGYFYGKLKVTEVDVEEGTLTFEVVANEICNDRSLVSPKDD